MNIRRELMGKLKWLLIVVFMVLVFSGCSPKYQISFNTTGGQLLEPITNVKKNESVRLPIPMREGHQFLGWYQDLLYTIPFTDDTKVTGNITIYAKWAVNKYRISFVYDSETNIEPIEVDYGVIITEPIPVKTGHEFVGWYKDENLTQKFVFNKMPAINLKLYAKWKPIEYVITYETNGGNHLDSEVYHYQDQLTLPVPVREGYQFTGWYQDQSLTSEFKEQTMPASNLTLYAGWNPIRYSVTWIVNGYAPTTDYYNIGEELIKPQVYKIGYEFKGWYFDQEGTLPFDLDTCPASNLIIYGLFEKLNYKITFINDGEIYDELILPYQELVDIDEPNKEGHTFLGWYLDPEMTTEFNLITPHHDITVYAGWGKNKYQVIFHENNGTDVEDIEDYFQSSFSFPITSKEGYVFYGWYLDPELKFPFVAEPIIPAFTLHLYAKWEPSNHWIYQVRENRISITGFIGTPSVLEIPSVINNKIVSRIEEEAFLNYTSLTKVIIPDTVTYIGRAAFKDCNNLQEIILSNNIAEITKELFYGCSRLNKIDLPPMIRLIGDGAFYGCLNLQEVHFSNELVEIGENAFRNCEQLVSINLPVSLEIIKKDAFNDCLLLKNINVPDKVIVYQDGVFTNTAWHLEQPDGVIYLGKMVYGFKGIIPVQVAIRPGTLGINQYAFYNSSTLQSVIVPDSLTYIGDYSFAECRKLQFIIFTEVVHIGSYAFKNCINLSSITIPKVTSTIGTEPFAGCSENLIIYTTYDNVDRLLALLDNDSRVRSLDFD